MKQFYLLTFGFLAIFTQAQASNHISMEPFKGIDELGTNRFANQARHYREPGETFIKKENVPNKLIELTEPARIELDGQAYWVTAAMFCAFDNYETALDGLKNYNCIPYLAKTKEENPLVYYYAGGFGNALFTLFRARLKPAI